MSYRIQRDTIAYKATCAILDHGPMSPLMLSGFVKMGETERDRKRNISSNVNAGWLVINRLGEVDVTPAARKQVEHERAAANSPAYSAPVPARQVNVFERPAYVPKKAVIRDDVPEWSKRPDGFSFKTIA